MRRLPPVHPFLLALLPVVSLFQHYLGRIYLEEILTVAAILLGIAAAAYLAGLVACRRHRAAAAFASLFLLGFLFHMPQVAWLGGLPRIGNLLGHHRVVIPVFLFALAAAAIVLRRARSPLVNLTAIANVVTAGMLLWPGLQMGWFFARHPLHRFDPQAAVAADPALAGVARPAAPPDVWYIILDRYPDEPTLRHRFAFDNREFYEYLDAAGFYRATRSHANYPVTALSLASSLNFEYLDLLAAEVGTGSPDWRNLYERIRHHKAGAVLRSQGYRLVHAGSWWWPTRRNPAADDNLNYWRLPSSALAVLSRSMLAVLDMKDPNPWTNSRLEQYNRLRFQFLRLAKLPAEPGPKFVFVHILAPHPPYVLQADGSYLEEAEAEHTAEPVLFRNQLIALNRMVVGLLERIRADSPAPPLILLQSDEGPYPDGKISPDDLGEFRRAEPALLREKTGILNAYYLPGVDRSVLYPEISPVNSFRLVFNHYFGARLPMLPDRTFAHASATMPYNFTDVTALVAPSESPRTHATARR